MNPGRENALEELEKLTENSDKNEEENDILSEHNCETGEFRIG